MYEEYFGLNEEPFSIAPDPHYIFMSRGHREALAHLLYGIERDGGFVLLTGEVGTGKTTICRCLLEEIPDTTDVALILNPKLTVQELLATICDEFGIGYPDGNTSVKLFVSRINNYLLDVHTRGRRAVLIVEEAQNLSTEVLEQIRLLTNLETNERKLLQIIMVGQPEITKKLAEPELRQLSQRITARYHLGPLSRKDLIAYVKHRLVTAGLVRGELFPLPVLKTLFRLTGGIPRLINVICDRALLGAYVQGKDRVDVKTLKTAAREVSGRAVPQSKRRQAVTALAALLLLVVVSGTAYYLHGTGIPRRSPTTGVVVQQPLPTKPGRAEASLADYPGPHTRELAYGALFNEWHLDYSTEDSRDVCDQARQQGLQCAEGTGNIGELRTINRPAVLKLLDGQRGQYYALLTSLQGEEASVLINNQRRTLHTGELAKYWSGEYLLLWQAPPEYRNELKPGESGSFVAWVERNLARAQGRRIRARRTAVYDEELVRKVKEFQRTAGLDPDGIVGPWTTMRLSDAANAGPVLGGSRGGK